MDQTLEVLPLLEDIIPIITTESVSEVSRCVTPSMKQVVSQTLD